MRRIVAEGLSFDRLFCVTDYVALGAVRGLKDAGLTVPGDVKVIGFDDVDISSYQTPSLSSVNPAHEVMATKAVDLLVRRIDGDTRAPEEFTSPYSVIARESTAAG